MPLNKKIGFLGAGKMATALARGFITAKLVSANDLRAGDLMEEARRAFSTETSAETSASNQDLARWSNILVLAVKPDQVTEVLEQIKDLVTPDHLLLSIAAGVTIAKMEALLPSGSRVIRVMPNTPALVGASASAFAAGKWATQEDITLAQTLLSAVGVAYPVREKLLDAVTGLSGSGPAYAYLMIEALSDGGVAAGLPREISTRLAAQTLLGAAKMVLESGLHPGQLKDMVTSPGGTTIEGLHELEKAGLRGTLMNAVRAASAKSALLGQK